MWAAPFGNFGLPNQREGIVKKFNLYMIPLTLFYFSILYSGCVVLEGKVESGRYTPPNGSFSFDAPPSGPQGRIRDSYFPPADKGFVENANVFGLNGVYYINYLKASAQPPENDPEKVRKLLSATLHSFVMKEIFNPVTKDSKIIHQKFINFEEKEFLFAIVNLPERSGAFDMITRKRFDAKVGILMFEKKDYVIIIRAQNNFNDSILLNESISSMANGFISTTKKVYNSFQFY